MRNFEYIENHVQLKNVNRYYQSSNFVRALYHRKENMKKTSVCVFQGEYDL